MGMNSRTFDTRSLIDHVAGPRSHGSQKSRAASAAGTAWNSKGNRLPHTANATNAAAAPVNTTSRAAAPRGFMDRADDVRAEGRGDRHRKTLPHGNRRAEFRILRAEILRRRAAHQDVLPVERRRFGAPLLLEVERPFVRRRAAEVEHVQPGRDRVLDDLPVEQDVRRSRRRYSRSDEAHGTSMPSRCQMVMPAATGRPVRDDENARGLGKRPQHLAEEAAANRPACRGRACCARTRRRTSSSSSTPPLARSQARFLRLPHLVAHLAIERRPTAALGGRQRQQHRAPCAGLRGRSGNWRARCRSSTCAAAARARRPWRARRALGAPRRRRPARRRSSGTAARRRSGRTAGC